MLAISTNQNPRFTPGKLAVTPAIPIPDLTELPPDKPSPVPQYQTIEPASVNGTRFDFGENQSVTAAPQKNVLTVPLLEHLRDRKVYAWLWVNPSNAADYMAKCEIEFWRNYHKVGSLLLAEALATAAATLGESVPTCTIVGANAVISDSIGLYVASPTGTQPQSLVLQPHCIKIAADLATISVTQFLNITSIRLWLGISSSAL